MFHTLMLLIAIVWINLLLSGDNAIVISMACRNIPLEQRRVGIGIGAGVAVALRLVLLFAASWVLLVPGVKLACGAFLFWVALGMLPTGVEEPVDVSKAPGKLLAAVWTVAIADVTMSTDNVAAVAAIASGNYTLLVIGMLISIPFVVIGATLISKVLELFPIMVVAGAALLGYLAATTLASDPLVAIPSPYSVFSGLVIAAIFAMLGFHRQLVLSK